MEANSTAPPDEPVRALRIAETNLIPAQVTDLFGVNQLPTWGSFDPTTHEGMMLLDKCETEADFKVKASANLRLILRDIYAHRVELLTADGEVVPCLRTCLITMEDKVYASCSQGVAKSILRLIRQHGVPTWRHGVPVKVVLRDLKPGRQWLELINDPDPAAPGTRKRAQR